jgi:hypothetical protein
MHKRQKRNDDIDGGIDDIVEAVLLWFSPGPWVAEKAERWFELTGSHECTSRALCVWLRKMRR